MQQSSIANNANIADSEKLELILKRLEMLTQQVEDLKKEIQQINVHFKPIIR